MKSILILTASLAGAGLLAAVSFDGSEAPQRSDAEEKAVNPSDAKDLKTATFGGGCFWCVEAVYQELQGVERVVSGYAGGHVENPTYEQICTGRTGHAEVVQITYDPAVVTYPELLEVFWKTHDPTTPNRQGNDVGPQYRSIVLAHDEEQYAQAQEYKEKLSASGAFDKPIVTEVERLERFYPAEEYHQNYFRNNPNQAYCQFVIVPKMEKFRDVFRDKLKD